MKRSYNPSLSPAMFTENNIDKLHGIFLEDKSSNYIDNFEGDSAEYIEREKDTVRQEMIELYEEFLDSF